MTMKEKDILIIGAGGHAREIAFLIEEINLVNSQWNILGFVSNAVTEIGCSLNGYEIYSDTVLKHQDINHLHIVIAIGNPQIVKRIHCELQELKGNFIFPNIIHPTQSSKLRGVSMGDGNIVCEGNIFTTNVRIGSFNCINRGCNISHDVRIDNYCVINPGVNISGGVEIGDGSLIGTGATILQYLKIGSNSVVGAGAVVTKNVRKNKTVIGIPAREII